MPSPEPSPMSHFRAYRTAFHSDVDAASCHAPMESCRGRWLLRIDYRGLIMEKRHRCAAVQDADAFHLRFLNANMALFAQTGKGIKGAPALPRERDLSYLVHHEHF